MNACAAQLSLARLNALENGHAVLGQISSTSDCGQRIDQLPHLGGGQIIDEFRQAAFEFTMFHDRSPF